MTSALPKHTLTPKERAWREKLSRAQVAHARRFDVGDGRCLTAVEIASLAHVTSITIRARARAGKTGAQLLSPAAALLPRKTLRERIEGGSVPEPNTGCWLWEGPYHSKGYGILSVRRYAHRVSYAVYRGPIPDGMFVCHRCDTPPCVNPDHLFLGTPLDNMRDMARKGRANRRWQHPGFGTAHPKSKLTSDQVAEIRRLRGTVAQSELARRFGVSGATVCHVQTGKCYPEKAGPRV